MNIELSIKGGNNRYVIAQDCDRHVQLECVWFCNQENLGDGIMCTREGQKIWVAKFFSDYMLRFEVDIKI